MRQPLKYVLLLLALLVAALPAMAQTATPTAATASTNAEIIEVGATVEGSLSTASPTASYTLDAEAGQVVTIRLSSEDFDTYLTLEDAEGSILAENDDFDGRNSAIQTFELPASASYTIIVDSYSNRNGSSSPSGDFTLSVTETQVDRIEYSQTVESSLTSSDYVRNFTFTGQEGDSVEIAMNSNDFDSYLRLLDSQGSELSYNDDGGGSLNSLISPYTLPSTGSYTIRASSLSGSATGDFTLSLRRIDVTEAVYGEPLEVEFTPSKDTKYITFAGNTGDMISILVDSDSGIDTNLTLNGPYQYQVAFDEDSGRGTDPEINQQLLNDTGLYTIVLRSTEPGSGTVTVVIEKTLPPSLDDGPQTVAFSSNQSTRVVTFTGEADTSVRISLHLLEGDSGSPNITVMQEGSTISSNSASIVTDLSFTFVVPDDGDVTLMIYDYSYDSRSYEITMGLTTE